MTAYAACFTMGKVEVIAMVPWRLFCVAIKICWTFCKNYDAFSSGTIYKNRL